MQNLGYAIAFACLLFALHMFRVCTKTMQNRISIALLCTIFFVFALQYSLLSLVLTERPPYFALFLRPVLALVIAPLLLLYFTSAQQAGFTLRLRHAAHFIPAIVIGIEFLTRKIILDIDMVIIASFALYALVLARMAFKGPSQFNHLGTSKRSGFIALVLCVAMLAISAIGETFIVFDIANGRGLSGSISLMLAMLMDLAMITMVLSAALQRPSPFDWLYTAKAEPASKDNKANMHAFEALVQNEKLFVEEGLSLSTIAKRLNVPTRALSEAINRCHGESYSSYMNLLRVNWAKKILFQHPDMAMIDIMYNSGFWSKSSFNKEFKARENMSPSEYRQNL